MHAAMQLCMQLCSYACSCAGKSMSAQRAAGPWLSIVVTTHFCYARSFRGVAEEYVILVLRRYMGLLHEGMKTSAV